MNSTLRIRKVREGSREVDPLTARRHLFQDRRVLETAIEIPADDSGGSVVVRCHKGNSAKKIVSHLHRRGVLFRPSGQVQVVDIDVHSLQSDNKALPSFTLKE